MQNTITPNKIIQRVYQPDADRVTVRANGIVVDIIGNDDGTVYVEFYAYEGPRSRVEMRISNHGDNHISPAVLLSK